MFWFRESKIFYRFIDIFDVILTSNNYISDNYYVKAVTPFISYINHRYITPVITRGQKVYDRTNFTGPITIDLSNIALGEFLTISTFISRFKDVNSGIQLIDVLGVLLLVTNSRQYRQ